MENIKQDEIDKLLTRGVDKIYPTKEALETLLRSGKKLKLYQGFDPTGDKLHLGHMVGLRKHRQWQDLGHEVIFLIGDGTGEAGDPTGKKKTREKFFTGEELRENAKGYLEQASKVVRFDGPNPIKIMYNGDWLDKLTKRDILNIAQNFSVQQLIERDMFQERLRVGQSLFMHEMLYPVFQGIDSQMLSKIYDSCDLEVGGTDQTFNMLMGRKVMEVHAQEDSQEPQGVLSFELLVGLDGKEKMSKSLDNYVGITDVPVEMFGKIMSIPDSAIASYFELCTFTPVSQIEDITKRLTSGKVNPRDTKMDLAQQIVEIYHGRAKADEARITFVDTFQNKKLPDDMPEAKVEKGVLLVDVLIGEDVIDSKSEFRRLMGEGAIRKDGEEKLTDPAIKVENDLVLKVGKHRFIKITVK